MPTESMPGMVRSFAEYQPMTPLIKTVRSLLVNESAGNSAFIAVLWWLCVLIAFSVAVIQTNAIKHFQQATRPEPTHEIQIEDNSQLYQILKAFNDPSMHHQAIDKIAPGLKKVAVAPEQMASEDPTMQGLFKEFINEQ